MNLELPRDRTARIPKKALLWIGGGIAVLILLAVVILSVHRSRAKSALAEKLAQMEAAGIPTTLDPIRHS